MALSVVRERAPSSLKDLQREFRVHGLFAYDKEGVGMRAVAAETGVEVVCVRDESLSFGDKRFEHPDIFNMPFCIDGSGSMVIAGASGAKLLRYYSDGARDWDPLTNSTTRRACTSGDGRVFTASGPSDTCIVFREPREEGLSRVWISTYFRAATVSYDGRVVAWIVAKTLVVARVNPDSVLGQYKIGPQHVLSYDALADGALALTRDGRLAAIVCVNRVCVMVTATGELVAEASFAFATPERQLAFSADGKHLIAWDPDAHWAQVWRVERLAHLQWLAMQETKLGKLGEGGVDRKVLAFLVTH